VTDATLNLTVNANEFANLLAGPTLLSANDTITIDGANVLADLGTLHALGGNVTGLSAAGVGIPSMTLGGASNGSYIVDMGTSGETSIFMEGTGLQQITASSATREKFSVGTTNTGGSTIFNLNTGDQIDTIGARTPALIAGTGEASAALVNGPGKWAFTGGVLTWWDPSINSSDHLTLHLAATAHGLSLDNNHHSFTVI
jgi:hypothetical protein